MQKPSTRASTWYGVQQATNAPRINEIVRNAFLARFSDLDFCRFKCFFFLLTAFSFLPILLTKSPRREDPESFFSRDLLRRADTSGVSPSVMGATVIDVVALTGVPIFGISDSARGFSTIVVIGF